MCSYVVILGNIYTSRGSRFICKSLKIPCNTRSIDYFQSVWPSSTEKEKRKKINGLEGYKS